MMENSETSEDFSETKVNFENKNLQIKEEISEDNFLKPTIIKTVKKKPTLENADNHEGDTSLPILELKAYNNDKSSEQKIQKSPSQKIAEKEIPIPYKEPPWSGLPHCQYEFEVIKNGVVIDKIPFEKPYLVVGRLSNCDIIMEHPSISRFHCIIQYRKEGTETEPKGVYVYDLESTHGTFQNKYRLVPKAFNRLRVGHMLKFGGSTRLFILQGPIEDQEPESDLTVTELKELANEKNLKMQKVETSVSIKSKNNNNLTEKDESTEGIDWGMGEDAVEDEDEDEESGCDNPFASNEDLYLDDAKKTLRGWYEREGFDLPEYQVEEIKRGSFKAKLELPISGPGGKGITCVIEHKGKKKEAVVQCALEACRILDRQGVLRQAVHESHEKKRKNWSENDYYDSDEDDFLDRTGDIERKRKQRKKELEGIAAEVETYETLKRKYDEVISSLEKLEENLKNAESLKNKKNEANSSMDSDDLDSYMQHLSSQLPDKHKRAAWKIEVIKLNKEEVRLRKLVNVARPLGVPELKERKSVHSDPKTATILQQVTNNRKILPKKTAPIQKVHAVFLEDEEDERPKLRKVDCASADSDDLTPIPYSKPQKILSKYEQAVLSRTQLSKNTAKNDVKNLTSSNEKLSRSENDHRLTISTESDIKDVDNESIDSKVDEQPTLLKSDCESNSEENSTEGTSDQSIRILGPSLPQNSTTNLEFPQPTLPINQKKKKLKPEVKKTMFDFEEKYENWVPPQGQSGDGRTALNEKLGY